MLSTVLLDKEVDSFNGGVHGPWGRAALGLRVRHEWHLQSLRRLGKVRTRRLPLLALLQVGALSAAGP